jgi:predicted transcriptional regulator
MPKRKQIPPISFKVPDDFRDRLDRAAKLSLGDRSSYIRRAVEKQVRADERKASATGGPRG